MALIAVIAVLFGGAAWLYVKQGDTFVGMSPFHSSTRATAAPSRTRATPLPGTSDATEVNFAGQAAPVELPCAIRRADIQKVLEYLTIRGRKTHADLVSVCKYYGTTVKGATS